VVLSQATWHRKAGNDDPGSHPEISDYLADIQQAIELPDMVFQSHQDDRSRLFYRLEVGRGVFVGKHLVVVVKYIQEADGIRGYVSTMYLSRSVYTKGACIWTKTHQQLP
jgi:hypothetical protein